MSDIEKLFLNMARMHINILYNRHVKSSKAVITPIHIAGQETFHLHIKREKNVARFTSARTVALMLNAQCVFRYYFMDMKLFLSGLMRFRVDKSDDQRQL